MRGCVIASVASALWAMPVLAQNLQETQTPVPIGGADTRSLPSRSQLPPMFGANLFSGPAAALQVTGAGSAGPTMPSAAIPGASGLASQSQAQQAANLLTPTPTPTPGAGAAGGVLSQAAPSGQPPQTSSAISATTVQPPGGLAAFDPNHVMAPGDVVQIHIYGATTLDQQATVDSNGDIFLPTIGPVRVAGITAGNLQSAVAAAVALVYHSNAQLYVTLAPQCRSMCS
jgi:hypothetical protein